MSVHMLSKNEEQWIRRRAAEGTNISKKDRDILEYYDAIRTSGGDPELKGRRASNAWGPRRGVSAPLGHYLRDVPALEAGYAGWMGLSPMQRGLVTPVRIRGYTPLHTRPAGNPLTVQEAAAFNEIQENKAPRDTWRTPIRPRVPTDRESVLLEGEDLDSPKVVKKRMTELDAKGGVTAGRGDAMAAARDLRVRWEREFEDWIGGSPARRNAKGGRSAHAAMAAGETDEDEFARADRERKAAEHDQLDRELVAFNDAIGRSGTGTVDGRPVRFRAMPTREQYERYREVNGGFSPDSRYFQDLGIELPGGAVNPAFEFSPSSRHPTSILDDPEGLERNRMTNGSMPAGPDGTLVDRGTFGPRVDPRLQSAEEMRRRRRERDELIFDALYGTAADAKGGRTARR